MLAKHLVLASTFLAASTASLSAHAQSQTCAPGSWFCGSAGASAGTQTAPTAGATATVQPLPPPQVQVEGTVQRPPPPPPPQTSSPYVAPPGTVAYVRTPLQPAWRPEWGITGRLSSGIVGTARNYYGGSGLVGLGVGARFRPSAYAAVQVNLDGYGGRDYYGRSRGEGAFGFDGLLFLNPRNRSQLYIVGGFGWASAAVDSNCGRYAPLGNGCQAGGNFSYFGGQLGFGTEYRFSKHWAINADLRGFVRTRIDAGKDVVPEFVAGNRATNTSGGGLLSVGAIAYF